MVTLLELFILSELDLNFSPFAPFVQRSRISIVNPADTVAEWWSEIMGRGAAYNEKRELIGSVVEGINNEFKQSLSISDCISVERSFYWDHDEQYLYIHYPHTENLSYGLLTGLTDSGIVEVNGIEYQPLINSIFGIRKEVDPISRGKMQFLSGSVSLDNKNGDFDKFIDRSLYGVEAKAKALIDGVVAPLAAVVIENDNPSMSEWGLSVIDKRKFENQKIILNKFKPDDFDDPADSNVNKKIVDGYGSLRGLKAYNIKTVNTGKARYKFAETSTYINGVYYLDDEKVWQSIVPTEIDLETASFNLSGVTDEDIKVDAILRTQSKFTDIIQDLNLRISDINFNDSNYNLVEWAKVSAIAKECSLLIDSEKELFEYFEELQNGCVMPFYYLIEDEGQRTVRLDDPNKEPIAYIDEVDLLDKLLPAERNIDQFATAVNIAYNNDSTDNVSSEYFNDDYFEEVFKTYKVVRNLTGDDSIVSNVVSLEDAEDKSVIIMEDRQKVRDVFFNKLRLSDFVNLKLCDIVTVNLSKQGEKIGVENSEVINIDPDSIEVIDLNPDSFNLVNIVPWKQIDIFQGARTYYGKKRAQVVFLDPDPENDILSIGLRLRDYSDKYEEIKNK